MKRMRLVWTDPAVLDRQAVHLACVGSTAALQTHLAIRRRRYPLQAVPSERGASWLGHPGGVAVMVSVRAEGETDPL